MSQAPPSLVRSALLLALVVIVLPPTASAAEVRLVMGAYEPASLDVRPGDSVTFTNADDVPHTVTSAWDEGASFNRVLKPGESVAIVFQQPGVYVVRCVPHSTSDGQTYSGMVERVRVAGGADPVPASAFPWLPLLYALVALSAAAGIAWRMRRPRPLR